MNDSKKLDSVLEEISRAFEAVRKAPTAKPKPTLKPNPRLAMRSRRCEMRGAAPLKPLNEIAQPLLAKAAATVSSKPVRHVHGDATHVIKAPTQSLDEIFAACCKAVDEIKGSGRHEAE